MAQGWIHGVDGRGPKRTLLPGHGNRSFPENSGSTTSACRRPDISSGPLLGNTGSRGSCTTTTGSAVNECWAGHSTRCWLRGSRTFLALCWANESWFRRWQGSVDEMLVEQEFSEEDDIAHIRWMIDCFKDPRYIRIHGRPLVTVYALNTFRTQLEPSSSGVQSVTEPMWSIPGSSCSRPAIAWSTPASWALTPALVRSSPHPISS